MNPRQVFSTVTGQQMTRSINWARLARNTVQDNYRAELGQITLQQAASGAGRLGVAFGKHEKRPAALNLGFGLGITTGVCTSYEAAK